MPSRTEDGPLFGGTANYGRVFRVADTVHRPTGAHTPAVHAFLRHLDAQGFRRVPQVLGTSGDEEVLKYLEGTAGTTPIPLWALTDDAIAGVGALLRDFHDHAAGFDGSALRWQRPVPARWRGDLVTHNDLNPANVIFRDGRPVAMIDFDLAAPGCAAFDLAVTACFWVPLLDARDIEDSRRGHVVDRLRVLLDGYRADGELRRQVVEATPAANRWIADVIEDNARRGHPAFGRLWQRAMGVHLRASSWLSSHTDELLVGSR
jgi:Ser/Thr protein kinase RdoA (MazF antagonist)